jgi:magnesium chelatase subunit D
MTDEALYGGIDLAGTLAEHRVVETDGVLATARLALVASAERWTSAQAARLGAHLDQGAGPALILLDEGASPDEAAPAALRERLAFGVDLDTVGRLEATPGQGADWQAARALLDQVKSTPEDARALVALAARFGVDTLRAPLLALRAARAAAAVAGRTDVSAEDIALAAELVIAPRATRVPKPDHEPETEAPEAPSPPEDQNNDADPKSGSDQDLPDDILVEAVTAALPEAVLAHLAAGGVNRNAKGAGAGQVRRGNRRGRPLPARAGRLSGQSRIDVTATLRAAAPWQGLRGRGDGPVRLEKSDIRLRRFEEQSDRLLIFAVDASGSAALSRLAEAKGAVEQLLGEAYARRDHVALVAFRGAEADLLLPPTRSLVQTKRRLAALPGGGGTPLAAGLQAAGALAVQSRRQGYTPAIALLTDGRANIALDGVANRIAAMEDSTQMARWLRREGFSGIVIDAGTRPERALGQLAGEMGARYLPLPRADARKLSTALGDALGA